MTHTPMRWRSVRELFYPRRASTQTWMMLTFALFVGLAVVGVGLYSFLVLRGQVREAFFLLQPQAFLFGTVRFGFWLGCRRQRVGSMHVSGSKRVCRPRGWRRR